MLEVFGSFGTFEGRIHVGGKLRVLCEAEVVFIKGYFWDY